MTSTPSGHGFTVTILPQVFVGAFLLAGCAATPSAPTAQLGAARQAISSAERGDAGRYAPGEIAEARSKLTAAELEVAKRRMVAATRLAEESRAEAELAAATTSAAKADAVNADLQRGNNALIDEMQRNAGTNP